MSRTRRHHYRPPADPPKRRKYPPQHTNADGKPKARMTRKHAEAAAAERSRHGEPMNAYHCSFCGGWHIAHDRTRHDRSTMPTTTIPPHPAKFSASILDKIVEQLAPLIPPGAVYDVLDPFAGVGGVHKLEGRIPVRTTGVELEREWAAAHPQTEVGDSRSLRFPDGTFDLIVTSPSYGNRMADSHEAREVCQACKGTGTRDDEGNGGECDRCGGAGRNEYKRLTYRHQLGRPLSEGSGSGLHWGAKYRLLHAEVWRECLRVLRQDTDPDRPAWFVLNTSSAVPGAGYQPVTEWHVNALCSLGCKLYGSWPVDTPRMGFGANAGKRAEWESVTILRAPDGGAAQGALVI